MRRSLGKQRYQSVGHPALEEGLQYKDPVAEKSQGDHVGCVVVEKKENKGPEDRGGVLGKIVG
jgi:hypothetical protein